MDFVLAPSCVLSHPPSLPHCLSSHTPLLPLTINYSLIPASSSSSSFLRNWEVGPVQSLWELLSPSCQKTVNQWLMMSQHNQAKLIWQTHHSDIYEWDHRSCSVCMQSIYCGTNFIPKWLLRFIYRELEYTQSRELILQYILYTYYNYTYIQYYIL